MRFGQVRVELQCALGKRASRGNQMLRATEGGGCEVVIGQANIRKRELRVKRDCLLQTFPAARQTIGREEPLIMLVSEIGFVGLEIGLAACLLTGRELDL